MSTPPIQPPPRGFRFVAITAMIVSLMIGVFASSEAMNLATRLDEIAAAQRTSTPVVLDPQLHERMVTIQISLLREMQDSRSVILGLLSIAAGTLFICAARLLRPYGLSRAGLGRVLAGSAMAAAVLRTLDGAQQTAILKRMGDVLAESLGAGIGPAELVGMEPSVHAAFPWFFAAAGAAFTLMIAGIFVLIGSYFGSERLKSYLALEDQRLQRGK